MQVANNTVNKESVVPFVSLEWQTNKVKDAFMASIVELLQSGGFIQGKAVGEFEELFAALIGVSHCIGVANGTDALRIAYQAAGLRKGDRILMPANSFTSTAMAAVEAGFTPVFCDVDERTGLLSEKTIEQSIRPEINALAAVHLYGLPCPMDEVLSVCNKYNLTLIEDNAQAQGSRWNGKSTGSFGSVNATSFYPTKNLGAFGDAGAITTNDVTIAREVRKIANLGSMFKNQHDVIGCNSRLDTLQAIALSLKIPFLAQWNAERRRLASLYASWLKDISEIQFQHPETYSNHIYHLFVVQTPKRDELQKYLNENGIQSAIHYPHPLHLQMAFEGYGYRLGDFPVAERRAASSLSLPMFIGMQDEQVERVCCVIQKFFKGI